VVTIIFVYIPAALFWLAVAFLIFAYFWTKYRDGVHRRRKERETQERLNRAARRRMNQP
jgi:hypothetical protein